MTRASNITNDLAVQAAWRKHHARSRFMEVSKDIAAVAALPFMILISPFFRTYQAIKKYRHQEKPFPPKKPFEPRNGTQVAQTQSTLLCLPPEIRSIIWTFTVTRHPIILHREEDRLAYKWLEEAGPKDVSVISPQVLEEVKGVHGTEHDTRATRLRLLAVLQTCQMIYLETLPLIYKTNTFAFLHNEVLAECCSLALPHHLSSIRSVHLHFRFRQTQEDFIAGTYRAQFPPPWDEYTFDKMTKLLVRCLPNLTSLSLFLQGPIMGPYTWMYVIGSLSTMKEQLRALRFLAVRLPQPAPDFEFFLDGSREEGKIGDQDQRLIFIERGVGNARDEEGQLEHKMADADTGRGPGWKIGTMYVPARDGKGGVERRHYAVEMEDEKQEIERY